MATVKMTPVNITIDQTFVDQLESKLKKVPEKSKYVLRNVLNEMAKSGRKETAKAAKKRYAVYSGAGRGIEEGSPKDGLREQNIMDLKKATVNSLTAQLKTVSYMGVMYSFDIRPRTIANAKGKGAQRNRPSSYRGKVLRSSRANTLTGKEIENNGYPAQEGKAFVVEFSSGHIGLMYRGTKNKAKNRPWGKTKSINKHNARIYESRSPGKMSMAGRAFKEEMVRQAMLKAQQKAFEKGMEKYLGK